MLYLDFQRGTVSHNLLVCTAFFETVRECRNTVLWIHRCRLAWQVIVKRVKICAQQGMSNHLQIGMDSEFCHFLKKSIISNSCCKMP